MRARRTSGDDVPRARVAVDRVDATIAADDLGQGDADVASARADVDAGPPLAQSQPVERGGQRPPVDVVAQAELDHVLHATRPLPCEP